MKSHVFFPPLTVRYRVRRTSNTNRINETMAEAFCDRPRWVDHLHGIVYIG